VRAARTCSLSVRKWAFCYLRAAILPTVAFPWDNLISAVIDAARDVSAVFQERSELMRDADAKPAQRSRLAPFDSEGADALIDAVQAATDEFITAVRTEKRVLVRRSPPDGRRRLCPT